MRNAFKAGKAVLNTAIVKVIYYKDRRGKWRWRLVARNNRIIANGGEPYASLSNARRAFDSLRASVSTSIFDVDEEVRK